MLRALDAQVSAQGLGANGVIAGTAVTARAARRILSGALAILGAVLLPRVGWAEEERPFSIGPKPVWYLLGGATTGGTVVAHDRGGYVGGEVSLVHLERARFGGLYGDAYRDLGAGRTYTTAGIEFGYKFIGIDGGAAARFGAERPERARRAGCSWGSASSPCTGATRTSSTRSARTTLTSFRLAPS